MNNYHLRVTSSSRRMMLVIGLLLIGLVFLFPTQPVEMRARSAQPEQTQALGKLAYTRTTHLLGGGNPTNIYIVDVGGSGVFQLTPGFAFEYTPTWSPDGTKIAFSYGTIWVANAYGTNRINLGIGGINPSWSVTGKIAFQSGGIFTMNPDGTNVAAFPGITQPAPSGPAWSPDGAKLAFASGGDIWVINADGTNEHRITMNDALESDPAWSPDGLKIAFSKRKPYTGGFYPPGSFLSMIVVINVDSTNEMPLTLSTVNGIDGEPSWSRDGTKIAFARSASFTYDGIYMMNTDGTNQMAIAGGNGSPAWQPFPHGNRQLFDFDGDFKDDFAVYRAGATPTAPSYWDILRSSNNTRLRIQFGSGEDRIVPADYNGDGKTDIAVFRPSNGTWYITTDLAVNYSAVHWGSDGDIPLPGDFDGDGKADFAVYRPSEGVWYILRSSDGSFVGHQFGTSTDQPLLMDYDGDRKTDLAFLRTVGTDYYWYILQSSNNTAVVPRLGVLGDKAVPADYDGDGKSNLAVYRPETGKWIILNADGTGSVEYQWGVNGDMPTLGNFDADGVTDLTIFRPDTATWYVARSSGSPVIQQWGISTDLPVTAAYIP
jgi:hypothetical protein